MRLHENRVLRHVARSHIYQSHKYSGTYPAYDVPRVCRFADQENGRGIEVEMQPQIIWGTSPCSMPNLEAFYVGEPLVPATGVRRNWADEWRDWKCASRLLAEMLETTPLE